jgi:hypothetical protein
VYRVFSFVICPCPAHGVNVNLGFVDPEVHPKIRRTAVVEVLREA